ncbi:MAG: histidine kinase [Bacteroidia bacterium]|nr:histidine kinase [Bacteroidia bacterium]
MHYLQKILQKWLPVVFILLLPVLHLPAQNYTIKTFTTDNGLPHNNVRAIAEDSTGFLWFGTWDGLSRYDGYEFKNYYHVHGDSNSISNFSIANLVVDKANNLWGLTAAGNIDLYDRINDNFKLIDDFGENNPGPILNMNLDNNGNLWIISKNELLKRDIKTGKFTHFEIFLENKRFYPIDFLSICGIDFSGRDKIWLSGPKVYEMEIRSSLEPTGKLIIKNIYNLESSFLHKRLDFDYYCRFSFYESPTGNCWIFSNIGLFKLDEAKAAFIEYNGLIDNIEFKGDKSFDWVGADLGLNSYDPTTHTKRMIKAETSQLINAIHHNAKNQIWFSNISKSGTPIGLTQVVFTNSFFKNYLIEKEGNDLPAVFSIVKDDKNNICAGVRGMDHIIQFAPDNKIKKTEHLLPELFKQSGHIRSMIRVKEGIWIGYFADLLMFYDFKSGQLKRHFADEPSFRTMAVNKEGNLFIGYENLSLYYPESGKTELLWKSTGHHIIYKLLLNSSGILWAGLSTEIVLRYNTLTKESTEYSISDKDYHVQDICSGDNNDLWLASLGAGLINFNPETGKSTYYTTSSGLSNNTTYCILKDKSGNIWISTNNGITRLNPKTGQIRIFNNTDGVSITEFNSNASYVADDGEFFFGGMGGFVGFYPDSLSESDDFVEPKILLTDFKVSGEKKILGDPLNNRDTIILLKGENNFQLSFSSTDFVNSDKTMFRYILDDINKRWIETDSRNRNINYSNLKPGWYSLNIQATNRNGEWNAGKKIVFRIAPYFYQTTLFLISVPLFIILLVTGFIILYIRQLKQKERQKQDTLRLQSLRGQMNPHFIFNSLNSINYFISDNDKLSANRYIADFSRLIRSILSNLGNDYVPFENEVTSIRDYLNIEHLRFGDKFDFELRIDDVIEKSNLTVFPGLVQPFIENAIWHGVRALEIRKGFIKVKFSAMEPNRIRCIVEDDGIGRKASLEKRTNQENHKSRGIGIVEERLQLISKLQRISYNLEIMDLYPDKKETGTRVEIDIPLK